jgi:NAD(P)H-dependent FMN reductase
MTEQIKQATQRARVGIIIGSNRTARIGGEIAQWVAQTMTNAAFTTQMIDLAAINLPFLDEPDVPAHGNYQNATTKDFAGTIAACDAFVLVFPQYNWGYPAVLKNALDTVFAEWNGKPVGTVIYGGHSMQADIAIRLVLTGLRMPQLATNVAIHTEDGADVQAELQPYKPLVAQMGSELALRLQH